MINIDKIIELGKLGYTKEEIEKMMEVSTEADNVDNSTEMETKETKETITTYTVDDTNEVSSEPKSMADQLQELKESMIKSAKDDLGMYIDEVKKDIQALNIFTTSMAEEVNEVKAEDLIGKILLPSTPTKKEGDK